MATIEDRARRYVSSMDPSISGAGGHTAAIKAAVALRQGFQLGEELTFRILKEEFNPRCWPAWSDKDLRHKAKSAGRSRLPEGYLIESDKDERPKFEPLGEDAFHSLITAMHELCPFTEEPDVLEYVDRRRLTIGAAHSLCFGLPPKEKQGELIATLSKRFGETALARSGLFKFNDATKQHDLSRFSYPTWRLCIPWRAPDGAIQTLQRRYVGDAAVSRKYLFPPKRPAVWPFGSEHLQRLGSNTAVAFCEGAFDAMVLGLVYFRDKLDAIPLGLPGLDGWHPRFTQWCRGRDVWLALDNDEAGEGKVKPFADQLYRAGAKRVVRKRPPEAFKDWTAAFERGAI